MGMISYASKWSWKNFQILPGKPTCDTPKCDATKGEYYNPNTNTCVPKLVCKGG